MEEILKRMRVFIKQADDEPGAALFSQMSRDNRSAFVMGFIAGSGMSLKEIRLIIDDIPEGQ